MSGVDEDTHHEPIESLKAESIHGVAMRRSIEVFAATLSWFLNEPLISLAALIGEGIFELYGRYLDELPLHRRLLHQTRRNVLLGSGLLMASPLVTEGTPVQWLFACLIGVLLAWTILITTGCMQQPNSYS